MAVKKSRKHVGSRKTMRKHRRRTQRASRRMQGRGWAAGPDYIVGAPGNLVHAQYSGPGKDCSGTPDRSGHISTYSSNGLLSGGRYSLDPSMGPLNPLSGVGTTPGPFTSIPCERGYVNPLNPLMCGGGSGPDTMRYYAPTAGYSNEPMAPSVASNPGIQMQVPYNARELNMACITTAGGKRRTKKRNGGSGKQRRRR